MSGSGQSPLEQFKIKYLIEMPQLSGVHVHFSNSALFMMISVILITGFLFISMRQKALVPGRMQNVAEMLYEFIAGTLRDTVGESGKPYFPFIFTLFMFILTCNILGLFPYSFTVTSHIAVTFFLAGIVFIAVTVLGIFLHGMHFFSLFLPQGTPIWMAPAMFVIELFAYLARPISLSVRLAANMIAGHTLLKVIAGFVISLGWFFGWAPLAFLVALSGFELFVAVLQAYIFTVLTCVYLNDAVNLH